MEKPFIIEVKGSWGTFKQSGDVEIGTDDVVNVFRTYLSKAVADHGRYPKKCPSPMAEGSITIKISYPKEKQ